MDNCISSLNASPNNSAPVYKTTGKAHHVFCQEVLFSPPWSYPSRRSNMANYGWEAGYNVDLSAVKD